MKCSGSIDLMELERNALAELEVNGCASDAHSASADDSLDAVRAG